MFLEESKARENEKARKSEVIYSNMMKSEMRKALKRFDMFNLQPRPNVDDTDLQKKFMKEMLDMSYILNRKQEKITDMRFVTKLRRRRARESKSNPVV